MKKILVSTVLFAGTLFLHACDSIHQLASTQVTYQPIVKKAPETVAVSYLDPGITTAPHTDQQQRKGNVAITCAIVPFHLDSSVTTERNVICTDKEGYDQFETHNTPPVYRMVNPNGLAEVDFQITIKNFQDRILKLNDVAIVSIIDGVQYAIPAENLVEWKNGLIVKNFDKSYIIRGPRLIDIQSAKVIYLSINDVPVQYDQAGNVTKKENFEWFFQCNSQTVQRQARITYTYDYQQVSSEQCSACSGYGYHVQRYQCSICKGTGMVGAYKCVTCGGAGYVDRKETCQACGGKGILYHPQSSPPPVATSIQWAGWQVKVNTKPEGATIKAVDIVTGKYVLKGFSNLTIDWYSNQQQLYPIIVEYQSKTVKLYPAKNDGTPYGDVLIDFTQGDPKVVKGTAEK